MNLLLQLLLGYGGWGAGSWALKRLLSSGLAKRAPEQLIRILSSGPAGFGAGMTGATAAERLGGKYLGLSEPEPGTEQSPYRRSDPSDFQPNVRTATRSSEELLRLLRDYQGEM